MTKGGRLILILKRQAGDFVQIGPGIQVRVISVEGKTVRLGVMAPEDVLILRGPELVGEDGVAKQHSLKAPSERSDSV